MIVLAGFALALVLLALAGSGHDVSSEQMVRHLSKEKDPRVVVAAAAVLEERGMRLTAEALRARAKALSGTASSAGEDSAPLASPLPEASAAAWTSFVRAIAGTDPRLRSGARLGLFAMHLRRLEELGCVRGVRRERDGRVIAEWLRPPTEQAFLESPPLQYRVFVASMKGLRVAIRRGHEPGGDAVEGRPVSLSGLLAVAHRLGVAGLDGWLTSRTERLRQRSTTALFERTNGIF